MSKGNKTVAQTYYEISDVQHKQVQTCIDYSDKVFTYLENAYTSKNMEFISVKDLEQFINKYNNVQGGKTNDRCILKGLFKDGFNGVNCFKNSPYLFFDIDVKDKEDKKENTHLLHPEVNETIFSELQKIAVICWRSNSGNGIAGVLYVPQLNNLLNENKELHYEIGKAITKNLSDYLHRLTGIAKIDFDNAQSKFRQVRFLAEQKNIRKVNKTPLEFSCTVEQKKKELSAGVTAYKRTDHKLPYGTITAQFDSDNDILNIAQNNGFSFVDNATGNNIRVKHPNTTSKTSGFIDRAQNRYVNYSSTLSKYKYFTPSQMVCKFQYNSDFSAFMKHLRSLGYVEQQRTINEIKDVSKTLKSELQKVENESEVSKIIFEQCYDLQTLTNEQKQKFIKENCPRPELEKYFIAYLNFNDYEIKYDKDLNINKYVSERLSEILDYTDKYNKIILRAETGKGKTTAFVKDFHIHKPKSRLLILVPLTIILKQNEKEYKDKAVYLDGSSPKESFFNAEINKLVFATYEQGIKLLQSSKFDYIVIDEVHQLITANSFKSEVIEQLTHCLNDNKIIGLTGTPSNLFKEIGFKLLNVDVKEPIKTKCEVRFLNNKPYDIALNHIQNIKGKALIRLNDTEGIKALKKQLVKNKTYKRSEILLLFSDKQIKKSKDFQKLAHERLFSSEIKLVLTTALIDEGLSINQIGFTDVVFIESNYSPRPEAIKQFFARFRNEDKNRKNYLYLRVSKNQNAGRFNEKLSFNSTLKGLNKEIKEVDNEDVKSTNNAIFSNDYFFYNDNTINIFYTVYSVTDTLFKSFNIEQFLKFLELNYNLEFTKNETYNFDFGKVLSERPDRKQLKKKFAKVWTNDKDSVLQALYYNTLDTSIIKDLRIFYKEIDPILNLFVIGNIKHFEQLYKKHNKLKSFGIECTDSILIVSKLNKDITLISDKEYKHKIDLLTLNQMIFSPQSKADSIASEKVLKFVQWCTQKQKFTHSQMIKELRSLGVYKNSSFNFDRIVTVLEWFEITAKKDTNTGFINVFKNNIENDKL